MDLKELLKTFMCLSYDDILGSMNHFITMIGNSDNWNDYGLGITSKLPEDGEKLNGLPVGLIKFVLWKSRVLQFNSQDEGDGYEKKVNKNQKWKLTKEKIKELLQLWWILKTIQNSKNSKDKKFQTCQQEYFKYFKDK